MCAFSYNILAIITASVYFCLKALDDYTVWCLTIYQEHELGRSVLSALHTRISYNMHMARGIYLIYVP